MITTDHPMRTVMGHDGVAQVGAALAGGGLLGVGYKLDQVGRRESPHKYQIPTRR